MAKDPSFHIPEHLTVPDFATHGEGVGFPAPRSIGSWTVRSVSTQGSFGHMTPSIVSTRDIYNYDYLDKGEFRLIRLFPGRKDDAEDIVRCKIFTCTLIAPQQRYVALSYAWGDVSDTRNILMEDIIINISASLESALRMLRDPRKSIWLWADALSINQQDVAEKAVQVGLMTEIYQRAERVAIWLGPQSGDSDLGMELIQKISRVAEFPREITTHTPAPFSEQYFAAAVALFEREYWHRLWVVQEVFNARSVSVHCGSVILPWEAFQTASKVFRENRDVLDRNFQPSYSNSIYQAKFGSYPQVLVYGGPGSLAVIGNRDEFGSGDNVPDHVAFQDLLDVMRNCRPKLSSNPRDKVFGILGVLLGKVRDEIKVNYNIPVKDVYTSIFRTVVEKTDSLDILCEAIHSPTYNNKNNLPSWVPDWSDNPTPSPIITTHPSFAASRDAKVVVEFTDRNRMRLSAIPLGSIQYHGITVGTRCTVNDYLVAFLQWRACLLHAADDWNSTAGYLRWLEQRFCYTLSLDHTPKQYASAEDWIDICYHVFASLIRERNPRLQIDPELEQYIGKDFKMDYKERRLFLQENFGSNMMGRCFCITNERRVGLGTGSMTRDDIVVVPLGCSTPVVLRPEGSGYRFVGDVYIHGYMYGRAVEECEAGDAERNVRSYLIH
jgi:hypothetical protein